MTITTNLILIPEAVKAYLNSNVGLFALNFVSERKHSPSTFLKDFTDLRVHILTANKLIEIDSRGSTHSTITVPVYINKRLNKDLDQEEIDNLIQFTDDVNKFLLAETIPSTKFTCMGSMFVTVPSASRLEEQNVFTSLLNLTYHDGNR